MRPGGGVVFGFFKRRILEKLKLLLEDGDLCLTTPYILVEVLSSQYSKATPYIDLNVCERKLEEINKILYIYDTKLHRIRKSQ